MRIVWDEPKRLANIDKHGLDFGRLDSAFFGNASVISTRRNRLLAIGRHDGKAVAVVFRRLGSEAVSIVSMRPAGARERRFNQ